MVPRILPAAAFGQHGGLDRPSRGGMTEQQEILIATAVVCAIAAGAMVWAFLL